jgi:cob(I)alamin adenosyltransferase
MKIYTKTGDKGTTSLLGGTRVSKFHARIEAYGTTDELLSHVGFLRDQQGIDENTARILVEVQDRLFTIGSALATDPDKSPKTKIPDLKESDIELLEKEMDTMNATLPEMRSFILPGGHQTVSSCHLCRVVCRRAERRVLALSEESDIPNVIGIYLNRLSDYFFVLARFLGDQLNVNETPWKPRV